jgi:hypothetical protein
MPRRGRGRGYHVMKYTDDQPGRPVRATHDRRVSTSEDNSLCLCLSLSLSLSSLSPCHGPRPISSRRRPSRSRRCRCHNWPLDEYVSPLSLPRFCFLTLHPNQSLQNVRNLFKTALASNTSLGDSGIANSRLAELTNLSLSPHILHI